MNERQAGNAFKGAFGVLVWLLAGGVLINSLWSQTISVAKQDELIEKISQLLKSNYVLPETGQNVSEQLLSSHGRGDYSRIRTASEFAAQLDSDLTAWSNDKHLGIVYDPKWVKQIKAGEAEDAYLTEEMVAEERAKNFGFKRVEILDGNVGYLDLRIFFHPKYAGATAVAAMNFLSDCDAVIVDLRRNGGGWGDMVAFLCSYFLDNEEIVHLNSVYSRPEDRYYQSWTSPYVPGRIMVNTPLYILTSKSTFSAAEEFCYNLKYLGRAEIVGEQTRGGAHPISPRILDDDFILILPELTSVHPVTKGNWEGVGVEPDIEVAAEQAFDVAYVEALERLRVSTELNQKRACYQWHIDGFKARLNPAIVAVLLLESYVGSYGPFTITLEENILMYQRGDRAKHRMIPMSETLFLVDEQNDMRIRFVEENGVVSGLVALYSDGKRREQLRQGE